MKVDLFQGNEKLDLLGNRLNTSTSNILSNPPCMYAIGAAAAGPKLARQLLLIMTFHFCSFQFEDMDALYSQNYSRLPELAGIAPPKTTCDPKSGINTVLL